MSKKILVPLDGSPVAEQVLPHVCACARTHGSDSELILLRVLESVSDDDLGPELARVQREEAGRYLTGIAVDLGALGLRVRTRLAPPGRVDEVIVTVARDEQADLVALCSRGRTGWRRFLGSVAEHVLRRASVPALLVPAAEGTFDWRQAPPPAYRTLLIPLDGSPLGEVALRFGHTLPLRPRQIHLMQADDVETRLPGLRQSEPMRDNLRQIADYLEARGEQPELAGCPVECHVCEGVAGEAILEEIEALEPDLVVMSTHGRRGLDRLSFGSVAEQVVRRSSRPVLLMHPTRSPSPRLSLSERNVLLL